VIVAAVTQQRPLFVNNVLCCVITLLCHYLAIAVVYSVIKWLLLSNGAIHQIIYIQLKLNSASEVYRPCGRRLSMKLVLTFPDRGVPRGERDESLWPYSRLSRPEPLLFLPSSSSVVLISLSGPLSRPTTSLNIWQRRESHLDLRICSQEL
jgi:hypothetical protein